MDQNYPAFPGGVFLCQNEITDVAFAHERRNGILLLKAV